MRSTLDTLLAKSLAHSSGGLENGDTKTVFLQAEKEDGSRAEPTKDVAATLGIRPGQLMKLEGSVYGIIIAPLRWHFRAQNRHDQHALGTTSVGPMFAHAV